MLRVHEITGDEQLLARYVACYQRVGGFPLDLAYVQRCRTYAFMDGAGAMNGGFLINGSAPFRSLNDMPDEARRQVLARLDLDQTFEVMCLWATKELRGTLAMMRLWATLLFIVRRFPKRDLLACTVAKGLKQLYMGVSTLQVIYEGKIHTRERVLDKYVILAPGKRGFLGAFAREISRRAWRWALARLDKGVAAAARA